MNTGPDHVEHAPEPEAQPSPRSRAQRVRAPKAIRRLPSEALRAVYVGVGALVALNAAAIGVFHNNASTASAVIGAMSAPIATLVGAYFGIKTGTDAGSSGKAEAELSRTESDQKALALAGLMDPSTARNALAALGVPMPPPEELAQQRSGEVLPAPGQTSAHDPSAGQAHGPSAGSVEA